MVASTKGFVLHTCIIIAKNANNDTAIAATLCICSSLQKDFEIMQNECTI